MILVTVGSSNILFDRLFVAIDSLCEKGVLNGNNVVAQTGKIKYDIKNYRHFEYTSSNQMEDLQKEAEYVICHAGTGTVVGSLKAGKKVIVFPRLQKYHEHESDHQLDLAREFAAEGYVLCAMNEEELEKAIREIGDFQPKPFVSNKENFCALIRSLL